MLHSFWRIQIAVENCSSMHRSFSGSRFTSRSQPPLPPNVELHPSLLLHLKESEFPKSPCHHCMPVLWLSRTSSLTICSPMRQLQTCHGSLALWWDVLRMNSCMLTSSESCQLPASLSSDFRKLVRFGSYFTCPACVAVCATHQRLQSDRSRHVV